MSRGWFGESARHSLAARGLKTKCSPKKAYTAADDVFLARPDIEKLKKYILSNFGGERFQVGHVLNNDLSKSDVKRLFESGEVISGSKFRFQPGMRTCGCHSNSAVLAALDDADIYTGLALSKDGIWRSHSWVYYPKKDEYVETTEKRVKYFGFKLNEKERMAFIRSNIDIDCAMEGKR